MTNETILPIGKGRRTRFRILHDLILVQQQTQASESRAWIPAGGLAIRLAEARSFAAVLQRIAGLLEEGLAP
jgi:hypothetical protein